MIDFFGSPAELKKKEKVFQFNPKWMFKNVFRKVKKKKKKKSQLGRIAEKTLQKGKQIVSFVGGVQGGVWHFSKQKLETLWDLLALFLF